MITIKFSHEYQKFPVGWQTSLLLDVIPIKLESLSEPFRNWNTSYKEDGLINHYPLPSKGDYMMLMLISQSGNGCLWTTIRRQTDSKLAYYKSHIGEIVTCLLS